MRWCYGREEDKEEQEGAMEERKRKRKERQCEKIVVKSKYVSG